MIRSILCLAALALVGASSVAQADVTLAAKFPDEKSSKSTTTVKTNQTLSLAGMDIVTAADQTISTSSVNGKRNADGVIVVQQKIDALNASIEVQGQRLSFDSGNPDAPPSSTKIDVLLDVFKAMSKSTWTTTYDKENTVTAVAGRAKALESLPEALRKATEKQLEESYLTQLAKEEMSAIPRTAVDTGDTWNVQSTVRMDGGQTLTFKRTYKYEGVIDQDGKSLHKITETTTGVDYDMEANGGLPLKYLSSELSVAASSGTILFDNEAGETVSRHSKVQIKGPMAFEAGGMELPAMLDLTMEQTTRLVE